LLKHWRWNKYLQSRHKANNSRQILRPGPPFVLVAAAEGNRVGKQGRLYVKCPRSLRTMKFVGANGNQVRIETTDTGKWFFAKPLDGVGVEQHAAFAASRSQLRDRLDGPDFIIGRH